MPALYDMRPDGTGSSYVVALAGIEPARPFELTILSRVRLPIPPQGLKPFNRVPGSYTIYQA